MSQRIRQIQSRINSAGRENLLVDGVWGPKSRAACQRYLRRLMPSPSPWPRANTRSLEAFYGKAGDESNLVRIQLPFTMYFEGKKVTSARVNKRCADSLLRVLNNIRILTLTNPAIEESAKSFGGLFNDRKKRGGSTKSLHAYGAAIDLDADNNQFKSIWPTEATMPIEIMEEFAKEGWLPAGGIWFYDAMHMQATQ